MGFLKRLFGKKEAKKQNAEEPRVVEQQTKEIEDKNETAKPKDKPRKYHVSLNKDEKSEHYKMWRVRKEQSTKTIKFFKTQKEAIMFAETLAEQAGTSVVVHKMDGSIRKQNY